MLAGTALALLLLRGDEGPPPQEVKLFSVPQILRDKAVLALLGLLLFDFVNF